MAERFVIVDDEEDPEAELDESGIPEDQRSRAAHGLILRLIIVDLAKGLQHKDIAAKYGYKNVQSITNIKFQQKTKVEEMKAMINAKQADLVVSSRFTVVMGYEKQIAEIEEVLDDMRTGKQEWDSRSFAKMQQLITQIRKQQMETLNPKYGHGSSGQSLKVTWKGVDVEKLLSQERDAS